MIDDFVVFDKAIAVNNGDSYLILLVVANGHIDCVLLFLKIMIDFTYRHLLQHHIISLIMILMIDFSKIILDRWVLDDLSLTFMRVKSILYKH